MREIKFRAWDERNKIMHNEVDFIRSGTDANDWILFKSDKQKLEYGNVLENPYFQQQIKIMQYTGLKDKNGVEIYEGDVVKWGHLPNRSECWHRVAKVEMFPSLQFNILHYIDSKTLEKKKGNKHIFGFSNFIYKDTHNSLEVIGNIYENEELTEDVE